MSGYRRARFVVRGLLFVSAVLAALAMTEAAERPAQPAAGRAQWAQLLPLGSEAPDFELSRLIVTKTDDGHWHGRVGVKDEKVGKDETVRLSSFRGKKPVCLIFSSYT